MRIVKPIIGVTMNFEEGKYHLNEPYIQALEEAGGIPLCLPYLEEQDVERVVNTIDGLLLSGGGDINPLLFGEEPHPKLGRVLSKRDESEIALTKAALQQNIPLFGICRGLQILNVALGGTIYQDIYAQYPSRDQLLQHAQKSARAETSHFVHIKENSQLHRVFNQSKIKVNSFHHQAICKVAPNLVVSGISSDGIIEGVELPGRSFCIGVQWHPEELAKAGELHSLKLFQAFVKAAKENMLYK